MGTKRSRGILRALNEEQALPRPGDTELDAVISSYDLAFRMQTQAPEILDLTRETQETKRLYGIGERATDNFGRQCLMARRLAERGVRMTQIYFGGGQPWDDHADILNHRNHATQSDQAIAALLTDLKQRGQLDETLVVWGGEFGRTPTSEGQKGRDHNNKGFSMWMSGGGVKGGMVYGATDEFGYNAVEKPVHVNDLHATLLYLFGIDHARLTYRAQGRDFRLTDVAGNVVREIIA